MKQEMTCVKQAVNNKRCKGVVPLWDNWWDVSLKGGLILFCFDRLSHLAFTCDTTELLKTLGQFCKCNFKLTGEGQIQLFGKEFRSLSTDCDEICLHVLYFTRGVGEVVLW